MSLQFVFAIHEKYKTKNIEIIRYVKLREGTHVACRILSINGRRVNMRSALLRLHDMQAQIFSNVGQIGLNIESLHYYMAEGETSHNVNSQLSSV